MSMLDERWMEWADSSGGVAVCEPVCQVEEEEEEEEAIQTSAGDEEEEEPIQTSQSDDFPDLPDEQVEVDDPEAAEPAQEDRVRVGV